MTNANTANNVVAKWKVSLACTCPECEINLNVLDCELIQNTSHLTVGQPAKNIYIKCDVCEHVFVIDIQGTNQLVRDKLLFSGENI